MEVTDRNDVTHT